MTLLHTTCAHACVFPTQPNRYEKYDKPMDKRRATNGDDPFQDELDHLEATVEDLNKVWGGNEGKLLLRPCVFMCSRRCQR